MIEHAARQDGGGAVQAGIADWETSDPNSTTPARIINLQTRRTAWLRLVRATRDRQTWELLYQHRSRWAAYCGREAA